MSTTKTPLLDKMREGMLKPRAFGVWIEQEFTTLSVTDSAYVERLEGALECALSAMKCVVGHEPFNNTLQPRMISEAQAVIRAILRGES